MAETKTNWSRGFASMDPLRQRELAAAGIPRPDFRPCAACEMKSACATARKCAHVQRPQAQKLLMHRLLDGTYSQADLVTAAHIVQTCKPETP